MTFKTTEFSDGPEGDKQRISFIHENLLAFQAAILAFQTNRAKMLSFMDHVTHEASEALETYQELGQTSLAKQVFKDVCAQTRICATYNANASMLEEILLQMITILTEDENWMDSSEQIRIASNWISMWNGMVMNSVLPVLNYQANEANVTFAGRLGGFLENYHPEEYRMISEFNQDIKAEQDAEQNKKPPDEKEIGDI